MEVCIHSDRVSPATHCIYCGATDDLTLEHIIPYGLWGRIEFPDASCKDCAKKIRPFETQVMQDHLGAFRQRTKIPLRKRRPRDYRFQLTFGTKAGDPPAPPPIEISGDEVPGDFLLLRFLPAKVFIDSWSRGSEIWFHRRENAWSEFMDKYENPGVFMGSYDNNMFCRLLAKIGHGLTLAYMPHENLDGFEFLLPDLILNGADDYHQLIGGDFTVPPASKLMHEWDISNAVRGDTEYLFSRIRLFACLGTPCYHAVVAKRPLGKSTVTKDPVHFPAP